MFLLRKPSLSSIGHTPTTTVSFPGNQDNHDHVTMSSSFCGGMWKSDQRTSEQQFLKHPLNVPSTHETLMLTVVKTEYFGNSKRNFDTLSIFIQFFVT